MHEKNIIHRDIKPDNFLMGLNEKKNILHVIDFGLSKYYKDPIKGNHIPYRTNKKLTGTARYASINTHLGVIQSRRDDLEGIAYVTLYLLKGKLPWQGLPAKNRHEKYKRIMDLKNVSSPETLCKGLPSQLKVFLRYCRELKFEDTPDYKFIKNTLTEIATDEGFTFDNVFDWTNLPPNFKIDEEVKVPKELPTEVKNEEEKVNGANKTEIYSNPEIKPLPKQDARYYPYN